jgi:hypothetical protein
MHNSWKVYPSSRQSDNIFFSIIEACSIAARGAGSQQLHSATQGTPSSNDFKAYASPSSRSTSFSPLMISAYTSTRGLHRLFEQTETQSMWVP